MKKSKFKNKYRTGSLRLKSWDYSWNGAYFLTICVRKHKCYLGKISEGIFVPSEFGKIVKKRWEEIPKNYKSVFLDKFVIMPNHLHGIIIIDNPVNPVRESDRKSEAQTVETMQDRNTQSVETIHELSLRSVSYRRRMLLPRIIGKFKMQTAKQMNLIRKSKGSFWQRNYYEHIIRNEDDLSMIRKYISDNPMQWELDRYNPKYF